MGNIQKRIFQLVAVSSCCSSSTVKRQTNRPQPSLTLTHSRSMPLAFPYTNMATRAPKVPTEIPPPTEADTEAAFRVPRSASFRVVPLIPWMPHSSILCSWIRFWKIREIERGMGNGRSHIAFVLKDGG